MVGVFAHNRTHSLGNVRNSELSEHMSWTTYWSEGRSLFPRADGRGVRARGGELSMSGCFSVSLRRFRAGQQNWNSKAVTNCVSCPAPGGVPW